MDATKPYEFIGFGVMDATNPYEFIGFGTLIDDADDDDEDDDDNDDDDDDDDDDDRNHDHDKTGDKEKATVAGVDATDHLGQGGHRPRSLRCAAPGSLLYRLNGP